MAQDELDVASPPPLVRSPPTIEPKLTDEDIAEVRRLQAEKMKNGQGHCEMCGVNNWYIDGRLWTTFGVLFTETGITSDESRILPMVTMICLNCGNTKFFHAGQLGLSRMKAAEHQKEPPDGN